MSIVRLGEYLGIHGIADIVASNEDGMSQFAPPVGCEIQVAAPPEEARYLCQSWKQALRSFGIDSPRRPELGLTIEASLPPVRSWRTLVLGISLLHKLQLIPSEADTTLHFSIQGNISGDARYLAFPLLFFHSRRTSEPHVKPTYQAIARLMSKGFVHVHPNNEVIDSNGSGDGGRTEFRSLLIRTSVEDGESILHDDHENSFRALQLLACSFSHPDPRIQAIGDSYKRHLASFVSGLPPAFEDLLAADWLEHTGDPNDPSLVHKLAIIRKRDAVRDALRSQDTHQQITNALSSIVRQYSNDVVSML